MQDEIKDIIDIRPFKTRDKEYIIRSWLDALYYGNPWFKAINEAIYYLNYEPVIQKILANPINQVQVACLKEDPSTITGFASFNPSTLHFIYVKPQWRKLGIARALLPADGIKQVTHLTKTGWSIKPDHIIFNPFAL